MFTYMEELQDYINANISRPLNSVVYDALRNNIIKGIIPVGERLNEKMYAEQLHISRTPIRNAIMRLKDEGLVEHIPNYGVVVKRVTVEDAIEIYKIRTTLETLATINAMEAVTKNELEQMRALLEFTELENKLGNIKRVIKLFSEFNDMVFNFAKMPRLAMIVKELQEYLARFRHISLYDDARRSQALEEHNAIYQGLLHKDAEHIAAIVKDHISSSEKFVIEEIKRKEEERHDILVDIYK